MECPSWHRGGGCLPGGKRLWCSWWQLSFGRRRLRRLWWQLSPGLGLFRRVCRQLSPGRGGAGGSGQRPSSPATEDNCLTAVLQARGVHGPGITAPRGPQDRAAGCRTGGFALQGLLDKAARCRTGGFAPQGPQDKAVGCR